MHVLVGTAFDSSRLSWSHIPIANRWRAGCSAYYVKHCMSHLLNSRAPTASVGLITPEKRKALFWAQTSLGPWKRRACGGGLGVQPSLHESAGEEEDQQTLLKLRMDEGEDAPSYASPDTEASQGVQRRETLAGPATEFAPGRQHPTVGIDQEPKAWTPTKAWRLWARRRWSTRTWIEAAERRSCKDCRSGAATSGHGPGCKVP